MKNTLYTVRQGGGSVMPSAAALLLLDQEILKQLEGKMDSIQYQEIQGENIVPSVRNVSGHHWMCQEDNNPKHTLKSTKAWLQKKSRKVLEWPSQSPDWMPISDVI